MGGKDWQEQRTSEDLRRIGQERIRLAARIAVHGIRLAKGPAEIVSRLRQIGLTHTEAEGIEDHARLAYQRSQMRIGTMLMVSGALWAIASILVVIARPGTKTAQYSWVILLAAMFQWLYGWHRRRKALRIRPMTADSPER